MGGSRHGVRGGEYKANMVRWLLWHGGIGRATTSSRCKNWQSFESAWRQCLDPT